MRILAEVGSRNDQWMKGYLDHLATGYPGNQDVTRFMHNLHREPRESDEGYNQQNLWQPLHYSQAVVIRSRPMMATLKRLSSALDPDRKAASFCKHCEIAGAILNRKIERIIRFNRK